jgi:GNAT superfamily N-acetyltransferase
MTIRRLRAGDGAILRDVRLRALREAPYAFSSWFDREATNGSDHWDDLATQSDAGELGAVFVALDEKQCLGITGAYFARENREVATLWGMWVDPNARRRGVGRGLVEAVATWARDAGPSAWIWR